ncbi:MAG: hypothetical protein ACP5I1_10425, partial [Candidatus Hinthialibacter sp.]
IEGDVENVDLELTIKVDTDGWVTGKAATDDAEFAIKRFYYEAEMDGSRKVVVAFLDDSTRNPSLFILAGRVLHGKLFYAEIFHKEYNKEGEVEKALYLGDNTAQELYPDYYPQSLKKALSACKPIGGMGLVGDYEK